MPRKQDPFSREAVGARLRTLRLALTGEDNQSAFARRLDLGQSGVSKLNNAETGDNFPSREIETALKIKFGIPTDYIRYGDERGLDPELAEKMGLRKPAKAS